MKRVRVERWGGSLLPPRNPRLQCPFSAGERACNVPIRSRTLRPITAPSQQQRQFTSTRRIRQDVEIAAVADELEAPPATRYPSPRADRQSAKLAALHARLSLPARFPLQTLSRCLIDASANPESSQNNSSLALLGQDLLGYHTAEWLICNYPRLPMPVLFAAEYAYIGPATLSNMRAEWGVEAAAAPGEEVDPGYLQFTRQQAGNAMAEDGMHRIKEFEHIRAKGTGRANEQYNWRRGVSSRIVYDDQFGDLQSGLADPVVGPGGSMLTSTPKDGSSAAQLEPAELAPLDDASASGELKSTTLEQASASFIRAVFGALYLHCGAAALRDFHASHILSRHLPLHTLFNFKYPTRDLSRLCKREGFEPPVARLESETGRHSRTPVFVVGVYSGKDKLGEDAGSSLDEGRVRAAAAALRGWYLYSPPKDRVVLPSQASEGRWRPQMVDPGEIIT
ncbi:54S ribosomal protein L3 mitochondrial [Zalaria obscura]|uniref:54S ribosomal protein L3 mitochondrial n=1 Tax=Zalaria obscura TaxID=2024903 RepID=A0ACC3S6R3_9PEZI